MNLHYYSPTEREALYSRPTVALLRVSVQGNSSALSAGRWLTSVAEDNRSVS